MGTRRPSPDPGFGTPVTLPGRERGGRLDLGTVGEALPGQGIPPEESPPALTEVEPAGAFGSRFHKYPWMAGEPRLDGCARVAGEGVGNEVEVAVWIGFVHSVPQCLEAGGIAGGGSLGQHLPSAGTKGTVDQHLVRTATIVQRRFDAMTVRRPAGCGWKGPRTHGSKLVDGEDRPSRWWVGVEGDDPRSFVTKSGSVLWAQDRVRRHRTPSCRSTPDLTPLDLDALLLRRVNQRIQAPVRLVVRLHGCQLIPHAHRLPNWE